MTSLEMIGAISVLFLACHAIAAAVSATRAWYLDRWHRRLGIPARDAVLQAMVDAGIPTCARPVSKRGRTVVVGIGFFDSIRNYPIDTSLPETMARDAAAAVVAERAGMRGQ